MDALTVVSVLAVVGFWLGAQAHIRLDRVEKQIREMRRQ